MKNNITGKQVFDVVLATLFVAWLFFEIIIQGNAFNIFQYSGFSGKLIVLMGHISPAIAVYMFMGVWGDVKDAKDFALKVLACKNWLRTAIVLFAFIGVHYIAISSSTDLIVRPKGFAFVVVPFCFLTCGVAEISFRGIIFKGLWENIPFFFACVMTGTIMLIYNIPLYAVEGTRQSVTDFALFYIYCIYMNILQGCIYRITASVFACMIFATYMMSFSYLYQGVLFERPAIVLFCVLELIAAIAAAFVAGVNIPGRGWARPKEQ